MASKLAREIVEVLDERYSDSLALLRIIDAKLAPVREALARRGSVAHLPVQGRSPRR